MKLISTTFALMLMASGIVFAADKHDHGHEDKPLHGGLVTEVKDMDYELVAKPNVLHLYVRDHGKPVDANKVSAKVTLLSGSDKQEILLKPSGDKLEAKGSFNVTPGTKVVAQVSLAGKLTTARFVLK
ncbi:MAG: hypothetical protein Q7K57_03270 [Burkholderiaceae bacterium]|uniref:hypothetical protein n=1 Tax=Rhodoferax sp. TaxID=50421 RepID=UPI001EBAFCB5|nr:hypothetical protein [Rhodoferax sp.]MBT9505003.1 hypothetical protein [Rhodoferax sp.]MDO8767722.1 hypothetical protein [Burkholderiaceae bacterium]MDO9236164.1 hypothetical protein [Aquabacterium sp.]